MVLPIVLAMLALGSLLVVPCLNYVSTSLKAGKMVEENVEGLGDGDALEELEEIDEVLEAAEIIRRIIKEHE